MQDLLSGLNKNQYEAVTTTEGPLMVMAGAGSGKTRVLTHRIAYIINELGVAPDQILAVTFTNKAAREMKERIAKLVDANVDKMWVSTFHSICCRILRVEISHLEGYDSKFTIIDDEDAVKIVKDIIKELNIDSDEYKPKSVRNLISAFKNDMFDMITDNLISKVYHAYQDRLRDENLLDFDDLILKTLEVFENNPNVLLKYQSKFQYIMVDEFQDTNTSQYKLIKLLGIRHHNIFIVGDQDQSIYSFRGAKVTNINKFQRDFIETKVILLEENYRSTENILAAANRVISNNVDRIKKNLYTSKQGGDRPVYYHAETSYAETMFVIDKIKELHIAGYDYKDFAIIYRSNFLSRNFEDLLMRHQIPYVIYGGISFFARKEVKDILSYIRLILNHDDDFAFKRIVNEPKRKIGPALINKLSEEAIKNRSSLFKAIDTIDRGGQGYNSLIDFKFKIIELYEDLIDFEKPLESIIDTILEKTGYKAMLDSEGEEGKERLNNIMELKSVIVEAMEFYEGKTRVEMLLEMLSEIALRTDTDKKNENDDVVKLMTYHQAKGLEYKVVFLVAFEKGIFPSALCYKAEELEEERRICYVGITRAKEKLYITSCSSRNMYGKEMYQLPSNYISEIGEDYLEVIRPRRNNTYEAPKTMEANKPLNVSSVKESEIKRSDVSSFNVGDKINHKAFGDGVIVSTSGDVITVAFSEPYGIKKLISSHPSIRRI